MSMTEIFGHPYHGIAFFAIYSFMGWLIEVVYRSIQQRRPVNAGFLHGPFVPLYGFGAFFILTIDSLLPDLPFPLKILPYGAALTVLEYLAGLLFERFFRLKLWDYSDNRFNIHGRVCLLYSALWGLLALTFTVFIHPAVAVAVRRIDETLLLPAVSLFVAYCAMDFIFSMVSLASFRRALARLYAGYLNLSAGERESLFRSFRRSLRAFPNLGRYIDRSINHDIRNRAGRAMEMIRSKIAARLEGRRPFEKEFYQTVRDIYKHPEFKKLRGYYHHNSSIYEHVRAVSYLSYRISKFLGLDFRSAARGALMHDFFLYDWRNHDVPDLPRDRFHGLAHPAIALANAEKHFSLNDIERDIIVKHMWPLTPVPPKYRESYIVTFADKYLSSKEYLGEFRKRGRRSGKKGGGKGTRKRGAAAHGTKTAAR